MNAPSLLSVPFWPFLILLTLQSVPIVIVGTKLDLVNEREVHRSTIQSLAATWNLPFYETSAKKNWNVPDVFEDLLRQMRAKYPAAERNTKCKKPGCVVMWSVYFFSFLSSPLVCYACVRYGSPLLHSLSCFGPLSHAFSFVTCNAYHCNHSVHVLWPLFLAYPSLLSCFRCNISLKITLSFQCPFSDVSPRTIHLRG